MTIYHRVGLFLIVLSLFLPTAVHAAKASVPPGSFLTKPVNSPSDLANLVRHDKVVASRYSKHYGMKSTELAEYFQKNFKMSVLKKTGKYTWYYIGKNERIMRHTKQLKAGTKVFVTFNGQPVMDVKCGNPMTKTLPKPPIAVKSLKQTIAEQPKPPAPPPTPAPTTETVLTQAVLPPDPATAPVQMEVLAEPPIELPPPPEVVPPPVPVILAEKSKSSFLPLLGLGAVGALAGGGGGGGGGGMPPVVPEPSSLLVLGMGGSCVLLPILHRRRNRLYE